MAQQAQKGWAVVTGATGGIGAAICERLHQEGWSLLLVARHELALARLQQQLLALDPQSDVRLLALDITAPEAGALLQEQVKALPGPCDLLINGAGCQRFAWLEEQAEEEILRQLSLNLLAPIRLSRALLPLLGRKGAIVNIGSTLGAIGYPGCSVYCASKAGLHHFTEALGREIGKEGPRVLLLAPRATDTEINAGPMEALNEELGTAVDTPERVADELMQLLKGSSRRRFIGWPEKFFARLNGLLPFLVDGAMEKQRLVIQRFARLKA